LSIPTDLYSACIHTHDSELIDHGGLSNHFSRVEVGARPGRETVLILGSNSKLNSVAHSEAITVAQKGGHRDSAPI